MQIYHRRVNVITRRIRRVTAARRPGRGCTSWKTVFLQNGNVDIARSEDFLSRAALAARTVRRSGILGIQRTSLEQLP